MDIAANDPIVVDHCPDPNQEHLIGKTGKVRRICQQTGLILVGFTNPCEVGAFFRSELRPAGADKPTSTIEEKLHDNA